MLEFARSRAILFKLRKDVGGKLGQLIHNADNLDTVFTTCCTDVHSLTTDDKAPLFCLGHARPPVL